MTGNENEPGGILGRNCKKKTNPIDTETHTQCLLNVVDVLNSLDNYDFIGLQEAANWKAIYDRITNVHLKFIHTKYNNVELVTFYNSSKINIIAVKSGFLNPNPDVDIRPYHIIFCYDKISNKHIIFINLHNGHNKDDFSKTKLQNKFKEYNLIMKTLEQHQNDNYDNCQDKEIHEFDLKSNFNENTFIIIVGDFNDHNGEHFYRGFKPFKKTDLNINNIIVSINGLKPKKTCCLDNNYNNYGDYILFSNNFEPYYNNKIYPLEKSKLYSDHLPIYTKLFYDNDDIYINKYLKYKMKYLQLAGAINLNKLSEIPSYLKIAKNVTSTVASATSSAALSAASGTSKVLSSGLNAIKRNTPGFSRSKTNIFKIKPYFNLLLQIKKHDDQTEIIGQSINYKDSLIEPTNDLQNAKLEDLICIRKENIIGYIEKKNITIIDFNVCNVNNNGSKLFNKYDKNGNYREINQGIYIYNNFNFDNFSSYDTKTKNTTDYIIVQKKGDKNTIGFIDKNLIDFNG
jgi:hypothetical protein